MWFCGVLFTRLIKFPMSQIVCCENPWLLSISIETECEGMSVFLAEVEVD